MPPTKKASTTAAKAKAAAADADNTAMTGSGAPTGQVLDAPVDDAPRPEWDDLSDDELRARLVQRDVPPELAAAAVAGREVPEIQGRITAALDA
jgi:hypothetical protein